jgi:hypothetical protein
VAPAKHRDWATRLESLGPSESVGEIVRDALAANERDRSQVAQAVAALEAVTKSYGWATESRGSYHYDDDEYQREFGRCLDEIKGALAPLKKVSRDLTNCPTTQAEVDCARLSQTQETPGEVWVRQMDGRITVRINKPTDPEAEFENDTSGYIPSGRWYCVPVHGAPQESSGECEKCNGTGRINHRGTDLYCECVLGSVVQQLDQYKAREQKQRKRAEKAEKERSVAQQHWSNYREAYREALAALGVDGGSTTLPKRIKAVMAERDAARADCERYREGLGVLLRFADDVLEGHIRALLDGEKEDDGYLCEVRPTDKGVGIFVKDAPPAHSTPEQLPQVDESEEKNE